MNKTSVPLRGRTRRVTRDGRQFTIFEIINPADPEGPGLELGSCLTKILHEEPKALQLFKDLSTIGLQTSVVGALKNTPGFRGVTMEGPFSREEPS